MMWEDAKLWKHEPMCQCSHERNVWSKSPWGCVLLTLLVVLAGCIFPQSLLLTSMSSLCLYPVVRYTWTHTQEMRFVTTICTVYIWCKCLKIKANPTNLQVRLSSFFILKLAVCPLQDVDGRLADMNSQSWKDDMIKNQESQTLSSQLK